MRRAVALVIATGDYQDETLPPLTTPVGDAEALAAVLGEPAIGGFEVTTLINEPHDRVGAVIGDFYSRARHDELTLLYFSGHGLKDVRGNLYLATTDTRRNNLIFTAISADNVNLAMEAGSSRQKILILDCCFSGSFPAGLRAKGEVHATEKLGGRGRFVFTASDATQYAFEGGRLTGHPPQSVFTRHLVAGLRDGSADLDQDGDVTVDELYSYVHDKVTRERPEQEPTKKDDVRGRIVVAHNVNWAVPGYLRNSLDSPIVGTRLSALRELDRLYRGGNQFVRSTIRTEVRLLVDDDSRSVAAAARDLLDVGDDLVPERAERADRVASQDPTHAATAQVDVDADEKPKQSADRSASVMPVGDRTSTGGKARPPDIEVDLPVRRGLSALYVITSGYVALSPTGGLLACGAKDPTVRLWSLPTGEPVLAPMSGHTDNIYTVAFSPDGTTLASAGRDKTVRIWDVATGKQIGAPLTGHTGRIHCLAFGPGGTTLASGGGDRTVRVWDLATGSQTGVPLVGHTGWVHCLAFSPDGTTLASGGGDRTVRVWDLATGNQIGVPFTGHTGWVYSLAFNPAGTTLASGSADETIRLFDVTTGRTFRSMRAEGRGLAVAFSSDGRHLLGASRKTVQWLKLDTGEVVAIDRLGDPTWTFNWQAALSVEHNLAATFGGPHGRVWRLRPLGQDRCGREETESTTDEDR
ncbi:caspase, EACC1-associated type [Nocardia sp. CA-129566]|uniref:caspase, EACC1-associated type n=1 Tax=Nocardia sp. CA-129566 TaxID=3239976 RepID=UPI003D996759